MSTSPLLNQDALIERKDWDAMTALKTFRNTSFFEGLKSRATNSPIVQQMFNINKGHNLIFQYSYQFTQGPVTQNTQALGTGEIPMLLQDEMSFIRTRYTGQVEDIFDTSQFGASGLSEVAFIQGEIVKNYHRHVDQAIFDTMQGHHWNERSNRFDLPSGVVEVTGGLSLDTMIDLGVAASTGIVNGVQREPLRPFAVMDGRQVYALIVDNYTAAELKKSQDFKVMMSGSDVRGNTNRNISGVIGLFHNILVIEAPIASGVIAPELTQGTTLAREIGVGFKNVKHVIQPGLRLQDAAGLWTGEVGFDAKNIKKRRCILVGAGAISYGIAKTPVFGVKSSEDYDIFKETMLEVWMELQKTQYTIARGRDPEEMRIAGLDFGQLTVDINL